MLIFWVLAGLLLAGGCCWPAVADRPRATVQGQVGGANVAVYRDQLKEAERDLAADLITPERFEQLRGRDPAPRAGRHPGRRRPGGHGRPVGASWRWRWRW
jgi:cytochrome c-type biogenesis protein CcmH/NrfG